VEIFDPRSPQLQSKRAGAPSYWTGMSLGTSQHEEFLQYVSIHNTSHSAFGKEEKPSVYFQIE
jgi:hypothetical protein